VTVTRQSDALRDRLGHYVGAKKVALAKEVHALLRETTPVDTGDARDGWEILPGPAGQLIVGNEEEHLEYLNKGSSSQAPAGFIEAAKAQAVVNVQAQHGRAGVRARDVQVTAPGVGGKR
jgi:hypothetical protein